MRTYELVFIADPRLSDEEVVTLTDEYKQLITQKGGTVQREESWGRRKLAYPINKLTEGRYVVLYIDVEAKNPVPEVELRLRQNDKILRYLTVRTDLDRKPESGATLSPAEPRGRFGGDERERGDRDRGERADRDRGLATEEEA
ncbi:MAG: 30S ribosomal protein S6 [Holophagales bacterium]|nr:MAG: 30S ribosomal protein S6 [Holophagales bacterium]